MRMSVAVREESTCQIVKAEVRPRERVWPYEIQTSTDALHALVRCKVSDPTDDAAVQGPHLLRNGALIVR